MRHSDPPESVWEDVGEAEIVEPKWIIKNFLPTGITFIPGPPKSYKSLVSMAMALTTIGLRHEALPPELQEASVNGRWLKLSMEAQPGVLRHTAEYGIGCKIPADGRFRAMHNPWKFRLDNPRHVADLLDWCHDLDALGLELDPLRNLHGQDENDSAAMIQMLAPIQQWAIDNDRAAVVVHHTRKLNTTPDGGKKLAEANDMRGTSALLGMADGTLSITALDREGKINIDAVFKRGEAWQRTIQLGIWGKKSVENISSDTKMVFAMLQTGFKPAVIAATMKVPQKQVKASVEQLMRIGAVDADLQPTKLGAELVEQAVRKFKPNS